MTSSFESAKCPQCAAHIAAGAVFCQACGQPVAGRSTAGAGTAPPAPGSRERAPAPRQQATESGITGRARTAGWLLLGGGVAIVLSAILPWYTVLGIVSGQAPTGYFLTVGAVGGLIAYFGIRALRDRVTRAIMIVLWVLAPIATYFAVALFIVGGQASNKSYGTVTLGSGFYAGLIGLVATVAGTIVLQTTRRSPSKGGRTKSSFPDGGYGGDATAWSGVAAETPPNAPRSDDGNWWWDGAQWHAIHGQ